MKAATLPSVMRDRLEELRWIRRVPGALEHAGERRQQHEHDHHAEVLDDEPADGDASALGIEQPALLQQAQQHDGARHRERDAEDEAGARRPALPPADGHAERRRHRGLGDSAGNGDGADRKQILEREVQADPEHQQDHADFGELVGDALIGDEARREGADGDAGEEIADQRRQLEKLRHKAEAKGEHQAENQGGDERGRMRHSKSLGQNFVSPQQGAGSSFAIRPAKGRRDNSFGVFSEPSRLVSALRGLYWRTAPVLGSVWRDSSVPNSMARCLSGDRLRRQLSSSTSSLRASKRM